MSLQEAFTGIGEASELNCADRAAYNEKEKGILQFAKVFGSRGPIRSSTAAAPTSQAFEVISLAGWLTRYTTLGHFLSSPSALMQGRRSSSLSTLAEGRGAQHWPHYGASASR